MFVWKNSTVKIVSELPDEPKELSVTDTYLDDSLQA